MVLTIVMPVPAHTALSVIGDLGNRRMDSPQRLYFLPEAISVSMLHFVFPLPTMNLCGANSKLFFRKINAP